MNKFDINDLISAKAYSSEDANFFDGFKVVDVLYQKSKDLLILKIENNVILPNHLYLDTLNYFKELGLNVKLYFKVKDDELSVKEIDKYLDLFKENCDGYKDYIVIKKDDGFLLSYVDEDAYLKDGNYLDDLRLFFYDIGYRKEINLNYKKIENKEA